MKKLFAVILLLALLIPSALAEEAAPRILVVFLSRAGENYNVGVTREGSASAAYAGYIDKGNTAMMAAAIAELTGGDLFEIQTVTPYPEDYASMLRVAQEEIDTDLQLRREVYRGAADKVGDHTAVHPGGGASLLRPGRASHHTGQVRRHAHELVSPWTRRPEPDRRAGFSDTR